MSSHADLVFAAVKSAEASSAVVASWRRSVVMHGLHPDRTVKPERDTEALHEATDRDALMMTIATPCIHELSLVLAGIDAVVMLADRTGLVLSQRNGRRPDVFGRRPYENVGKRFREQDVGTGPVGTVLVEERPIMFASGECFSVKVAGIVSMGAPIFGPDGRVLGVLACGYTNQLGAVHSSFGKLLFMMLSQFARQIGCEVFAKTFPQARLLQVPQAGDASCAVVAVGADDLVLGATRSARRLLGLSDARLGAGLSVAELLGTPEVGDLAAAEAKLIAQTMVRYAYNRSAVAKALGISRSTLYRKLDELQIQRDDHAQDAGARSRS